MKLYISMPEGENKARMLTSPLRERLCAVCDVEENCTQNQLTPEQIRDTLKAYDIVLTSWGCTCIHGRDLEDARTRMIGHLGGTVRTVVDREALERGVYVVSGNAVFPKLIAEGVLFHMLAGLKRWHESDRALKAGARWNEGAYFGGSLFRKKVGLLGYGQIAREVARLLRPFDAEIFVSDPYVRPEAAVAEGMALCSEEDLYRNCEIISLHHTLTEETYHMVGARQLAMIRDGAVLINTARGGIIDEKALEAELRRGRIYALLDVYEKEPLPLDSGLRKIENVFITPHLGAYSAACYQGLAEAVVRQVEEFVLRGTPTDWVTPEQYDRMTDEGIMRKRR